MRRFAIPLLLALATTSTPPGGAEVAAERLSLAVYFHIVDGLAMTRKGRLMDSWVDAADVRDTLLPEANRIWRPAGIEWTVAGIDRVAVADGELRDRTLATLLAARRDATGRADKRRVRRLDELLDTASAADNAVHVYLVPYLGAASQGNASRTKQRVFVAQWTDKPSRGKKPPERFPLVEPEPFEHGSLGRTLAHEFGHVLGLRHPDKQTQRIFGRLMGGKRPGYALTAAEIESARARARAALASTDTGR